MAFFTACKDVFKLNEVRAQSYWNASIGVGNSIFGSRFEPVYEQELQRRADEIKVTGREQWCTYQQAYLQKMGVKDIFNGIPEEGSTHSAPLQQLIKFRTPSDNIHCMFVMDENKTEPNGIACDIRNRSNERPILPKPKDCEFDWGQRFELGNSSDAGLECVSDSVRGDDSRVLQYGSSMRLGNIVCSSLQSGLECRNDKGRGFFLSRSFQKIF